MQDEFLENLVTFWTQDLDQDKPKTNNWPNHTYTSIYVLLAKYGAAQEARF